MAGATEVGGGGEVISSDVDDSVLRKFLKDSNITPGSLADMYAKDQLLMMYALPDPIKKRLRALKKQQLDIINLEAQFYKDIHNLEIKYYEKYKTLFDKRAKVVIGKHEPREDELHPDDVLPDIPPEIEAKLKMEQAKMPDGPGVPNFWLTIFRNVSSLNDVTFPCDEDILKHLVDIKVTLENEPMGFRLEFIFSPNEYFTNNVLTKEYYMTCKPDDANPFSFEGPEIRKARGCTIDWKPGKDVTVRTIKKKQKHKTKGSVRTVIKTVKNESFFNFFSPPSLPDTDAGDVDDETQLQITSDFEIGHYLRERVIPHAILYYTGEALEDEESYEEDEEEDETRSSDVESSSEEKEEENEEEDKDEEDDEEAEVMDYDEEQADSNAPSESAESSN